MKTRSKRTGNTSLISSPDVFPNTAPVDSKVPIDDEVPKMDVTNTYYTYFYQKVNASVHTFTLNNLKHYTQYSVSVKALREGAGDNTSKFTYENVSTLHDVSIRIASLFFR